jgi:hypothetical protein
MRRAVWLFATLPCLVLPQHVFAHADVVLTRQGAAWTDTTPAAAIGGNTATTLGEQRRQAVDYAANLWAEQLNSTVPIQVLVTFDDLGCTSQGALLGQAGATSGASGISSGGADPTLWYPSALADRLAGSDLSPGDPDIELQLNSSLDTGQCKTMLGGFYYGFDGHAGENGANTNDLIEVALHELGHGLGFASFVDLSTGKNAGDGSDTFSSHIRDLTQDKLWSALSDAERLTSTTNVRQLVFDGVRTQAASAALLAKGAPSLVIDPVVTGFSGFVATAAFAENPALNPASGPLQLLASGAGCKGTLSGVRGAVILAAPTCDAYMIVQAAAAGGAVGALIEVPSPAPTPARPLPLASVNVDIPVITLGTSDANLLVQALQQHSLTARLGGSPALALGADPQQRPFLYATNPVSKGSSVSHFDPLAYPDLLMEPFSTPPAKHDPDLTLPALQDIGWGSGCGNGQVDPGEECDDGSQLSDTLANACRSNCQSAHCGDGVLDNGEHCDSGANNSDTLKNSCRKNCSAARCGDGVIDDGEQCDDGASNSDTLADACRTTCQRARCGDGVVDQGESCDGAAGCNKSCSANAAGVTSAAGATGAVAAGHAAASTAGASAAISGNAGAAASAASRTDDHATSSDAGCGCHVLSASTSHTPRVAASGLSVFGLLLLTIRRRRRTRR